MSRETDPFWTIVDANNLPQVVVDAAADDESLKLAAHQMLQGLRHDKYKDEYAEALSVVERIYGLAPEHIDMVLNLCELKVCEEINSGSQA